MKKFVERLSKVRVGEDVKNPWDYSRPGNAVRRKNLESYLWEMHKRAPTVLLIGEAPGYRGCGRVGMPFSSEKLVLSHPFFCDRALFGVNDEHDVIAEASASIVWKTFDMLDFYPLMWATYPFHPHKLDNPLSNRAPRPDEMQLGKSFIEEIVTLFPIEHVIAVGRVAEKTLTDMGIPHTAVRHPSHGGATAFAAGLKAFVRKHARK